ncbi:MAG: Response regulator receiver domain [Thermoplasmata archaeon]|jgi:CheY-like chemotaxis protein|nr:Response regulator receiver domain [Thermoplasmata archaeon]
METAGAPQAPKNPVNAADGSGFLGARRFRRSPLLLRALVAAGLAAVAVVRLLGGGLRERMDQTFLLLLGGAALALLVPWDRLSSLKAGRLELALDPVHRVLREFPERRVLPRHGVEWRADPEELRRDIEHYAPLLPQVQGRRVLWVDDTPALAQAERRLLRSMGVEVVPVTSSRDAWAALETDNDFDLLISDCGREAETAWLTSPVAPDAKGVVWEGVEFALKVVRVHPDPRVRSLPILFYSANDQGTLEAVTAPVRRHPPLAAACSTPRDFLRIALQVLLFPAPSDERTRGEKVDAAYPVNLVKA